MREERRLAYDDVGPHRALLLEPERNAMKGMVRPGGVGGRGEGGG
jgi:hypothetical protein